MYSEDSQANWCDAHADSVALPPRDRGGFARVAEAPSHASRTTSISVPEAAAYPMPGHSASFGRPAAPTTRPPLTNSRAFWLHRTAVPIDLSDASDVEYIKGGLRDFDDCLCTLTHASRESEVQHALLLFHLSRFITRLEELPETVDVPEGIDDHYMSEGGANAGASYFKDVRELRRIWRQVDPVDLTTMRKNIDRFDAIKGKFSRDVNISKDDSILRKLLTFLRSYELRWRMRIAIIAATMGFAALVAVLFWRIAGDNDRGQVAGFAAFFIVGSHIPTLGFAVFLHSLLAATQRVTAADEAALHGFLKTVAIHGAAKRSTETLPSRPRDPRVPLANSMADVPPIHISSNERMSADDATGSNSRQGVQNLHLSAGDSGAHFPSLEVDGPEAIVPVPWDALHRTLVVMAVSVDRESRSLRTVYWNEAAKAATGVSWRPRFEEFIHDDQDPTVLKDPIVDLAETGTVGTFGDLIEVRFKSNTHVSVSMRLRPVLSAITTAAGSPSDANIVVLVGHGSGEDDLMQSLAQLKQSLLQMLLRERTELSSVVQRATHEAIASFAEGALSWDKSNALLSNMRRWKRTTWDDVKSMLPVPITARQSAPLVFHFDRSAFQEAIACVLKLVETPGDQPISLTAEAVHECTGVMNALRVSFTPSQSTHVELVLQDPTAKELCANACIGIEAFRPLLEQDSTSGTGSQVTTMKLALLIPYTLRRPAANMDVDDDDDDADEVVARSAYPRRDAEQVRITVVLMFKDKQLQTWLRQSLVTARSAVVVTVITASTAKELGEKMSHPNDPVHAVFIEEEGRADEADLLRKQAFSSKEWGQTVVVTAFSSDGKEERALYAIPESVVAAATAGGGIGGWQNQAEEKSALGKRHEIPGADGERSVYIDRNYRFLLPIGAAPLGTLLGYIQLIETHRLQLERKNNQHLGRLAQRIKKNYVQGEVLGQGARANVRVAELGRERYAMKPIVWTTEDPESEARCQDELCALQELEGKPFVVRLHDHYLAETENTLRLYLEYCEWPLSEILCDPVTKMYGIPSKTSEAVVQIKKIAVVLFQVTTALNEAHKAGWVHHDVKPDNVMIKRVASKPGRFDWEARLCDFSESAKVDVKKFPRPRGGTIAFNSVEKSSGMNCTEIDIFALGVFAMQICGWAPEQWNAIQRLVPNLALAEMIKLAPVLKQRFEEHVQTLPTPKATNTHILCECLKQFILACLQPEWSERPSATALLTYDLLKWIQNEQHTGATLNRNALPEFAGPHPPIGAHKDDAGDAAVEGGDQNVVDVEANHDLPAEADPAAEANAEPSDHAAASEGGWSSDE